jgi:hypothetical protein
VLSLTNGARDGRCWELSTLNLEDVFLVHDESFWYDEVLDQSNAVDNNMMRKLSYINLQDCIHLTDFCTEGIVARCLDPLSV